jgi:molybdenum-dependent DNA-binding transcriptional regulator ModE
VVEAARGIAGHRQAGRDGRDHFARGFAAAGGRIADGIQCFRKTPEIVDGFRRSAKPTVGTAVSQCALTMTMARGSARVAALATSAAPAAPGRSAKVGAPCGTKRTGWVWFMATTPVAMGELYAPSLQRNRRQCANHYCWNCNNGPTGCNAIFVRVAELGSFSGAAQQLGVARSVVTRQIAALEAHLGVKLMARSTRRLTLTSAGTAYLEKCRVILNLVEAAEIGVAEERQTPRGNIRISLPLSFGLKRLAPLLLDFRSATRRWRWTWITATAGST